MLSDILHKVQGGAVKFAPFTTIILLPHPVSCMKYPKACTDQVKYYRVGQENLPPFTTIILLPHPVVLTKLLQKCFENILRTQSKFSENLYIYKNFKSKISV